VSSGAEYTVPPGYTTLTSWSISAGPGVGQTLKMKVYRKVANPDFYSVVGVDGPRLLAPSTLNTFQVNIPVQAGDIVGLNDGNAPAVPNACLFQTLNPADLISGMNGSDLATGETAALPPGGATVRVNVSATVARPASVAALAPSSGSFKGGTPIAITGSDFTGATAVSFGNIPAIGFTVNSETSITATVPPTSVPGAIDVSVTTPAGKSAAAASDQFTYTACVVPKLKGKKLKAVRKALTTADCKLGTVKGKKGKTAKVKGQGDRPGSVLSPGSKINVRLGGKAAHP
jgi:hypothetical protein